MNKPDTDATDRDRFLALYNSYARAYERFLENGFKTSAILLVVTGWLLSSSDAQKYLAVNDAARILAMGMVIIGATFLCLTFRHLLSLSHMLRTKLDGLGFIHSDCYDQHQISPLIFWSAVGQNFLFCIFNASVLMQLGFRGH
jgi:hypothetical protein